MSTMEMIVSIVLSTTTGVLGTLVWRWLQKREREDLLFRIGDLTDASSFIVKLRDVQNPVSEYLWWRLSPTAQPLVQKYDPSIPPPESLKQSLVMMLNRLLRDQSLFEHPRFKNVKVREDVKKLALQVPDDEDLPLLNRMIIEDAYPSEIARRTKKKYLSHNAGVVAILLSAVTFVVVFSLSSLPVSLPIMNRAGDEIPSRTSPVGQPRVLVSSSSESSESASGTHELITIIKQQQEVYIGPSSGPWAQHNFTEVELKLFKANRTVDQALKALRNDAEFLRVVQGLRSMSPQEQNAILEKAAQTYHPTWTELELDSTIDPSRELRRGQTDAAQNAERLIAEGVVNLVRNLI